jgi:hypothetical protein
MEHASDVLSPRPVQTPQELNLDKLAKRKTKKTRLSFKQDPAFFQDEEDPAFKPVAFRSRRTFFKRTDRL